MLSAVQDCAREAEILQQLEHPHIISCLHASLTPGQLYITTPYQAGGNLKNLLRGRQDPLPWEQRLSYARQIAGACEVLHQHGLIHRDIKAENILLDGALQNALLADFGLARRLNDPVDPPIPNLWLPATVSIDPKLRFPNRIPVQMHPISEESALSGTPSHMAPELFEVSRAISDRADVYAFGVLLWELLTRECPFPGMDFTAIAFHTLADGKFDIRSVPPFVPAKYIPASKWPAAYQQLMASCWLRDPLRRPSFTVVKKILSHFQPDGFVDN